MIRAGAGILGAGLFAAHAAHAAETTKEKQRIRYSMCDWSMGRRDPSAFELAKRIGLDGVEISIGTVENKLWLRDKETQKKYLDAAREQNVAISSMAMGVLNDVPLMSEPRAALWVADTIDVAARLGIKIVLLAFFGKGELKAENADDMRRVTEALQELAPRAEKAGVTLGLETYLSAESHLKIIDAVNSKAVKVYYDVYNSNRAGHPVVQEIKQLGKERICQVHFKEGRQLLGTGTLDWPAVVDALHAINYTGWAVLETQSPNDVLTDTRTNLAYLKKLFSS